MQEIAYVDNMENQRVRGHKDYAAVSASRCGNCGGHLQMGVCPKCQMDNTTFVERSHNVPKVLRNFMYVTYIILIVAGLALITEVMATGDLCLSVTGNIFPIVGALIFGLMVSNQVDSIKKKGYGWCYKCKQLLSPRTKYCIYCGKHAFWHLTKVIYIVLIIVIALIVLFVGLLVAFQPVDLSIERVDFPSAIGGTTVPVEITLKCIGTKVAYAEDIEIKIDGMGIETSRFSWPEDIEPRTTSTGTFTVNILPGSMYFSIDVTVYYEGIKKDFK
jgi:RNA polymerase subunit RPABC4/transcription elongation factor Spt4